MGLQTNCLRNADDIGVAMSQLGFRYHYIVWRVLGLWSLPTDWKLLYYAYSCLINIPTQIVFSLTMLLALQDAQNLDEVIEIFVLSITTVTITTHALLLVRNKQRLKRLVALGNQLKHGIEEVPEELGYFTAARRVSRNVLISFSLGTYSTIGWNVYATLSAENRRLMYRAWVPFDWDPLSSEGPYLGIVIFQIIGNTYLAVVFSSVAVYGLQFFGTLSAFMNILASRLRRLGVPGDSEPLAERKLVECIKYHHLCLRYSELINDIFDVHYLIQFIASGLAICVTAFQLSVVSPSETEKFIFTIMYGANMTLMLLIPCLFGSIIRDRSERFAHDIFSSNWLSQTRRFRGAMKMFIERSQRPVELFTYKKLVIIALPTYVMTCRAAYSLLSCLRGL